MGLSHAKCLSNARLDGQTVIVTGSNTGIGKCTVEDLFKRGARVIMACRNLEKANAAADDIKAHCSDLNLLGEIIVTELDLCSLASVRECATKLLDTEERIDILINNAGIMACPQSKTKDGFEMQFGTNHLGHFLFTILLLPRLIRSGPARIVNVSSKAYFKGRINFDDINHEKRQYSAFQAYADSKLSNILFTKELVRRLEAANIRNVNAYSLHPGVISTELGRHLDKTYFKGLTWTFSVLFRSFLKTPEQGAQTTLYCALDENAGKETGLYYAECKVEETNAEANNVDSAKTLWQHSLMFVGLDENYNPFVAK